MQTTSKESITVTSSFFSNLLNESTVSPQEWSAKVYALLKKKYSADKKDVSRVVEPAIAKGAHTKMSPEQFVQAMADRFGFFEMDDLSENLEFADRRIERDIFENYVLLSVYRPNLSVEMNESILEGVVKTYLKRKDVQFTIHKTLWMNESGTTAPDYFIQITSPKKSVLESIVSEMIQDRYITGHSFIGLNETIHHDGQEIYQLKESIPAYEGFLRLRRKSFPKMTARYLGESVGGRMDEAFRFWWSKDYTVETDGVGGVIVTNTKGGSFYLQPGTEAIEFLDKIDNLPNDKSVNDFISEYDGLFQDHG